MKVSSNESGFPDVLVIHGPNLNRLGQREPDVYGHVTLDEVNQQLIDKAQSAHVRLECFQSNHEGEIIDRLHLAGEQKVKFLIINPGGFTHTSVSIRDAVLSVNLPCVEVHLSNVFKRESFRQHSYFSDIAVGIISGLGTRGYLMALDFAIDTVVWQ